MLAAVVARADSRFPSAISDDFNRANSSNLGFTPEGYTEWQELRGQWEVANNRLRVASTGPNPLVVVNGRRSDVEIEVGIADSGGDGLAVRATDADNYLRVAYYLTSSTTTNYVTEERYICVTSPVETPFHGLHTHDVNCWSSTGSTCCSGGSHSHGTYGDHGNYLSVGPFETRQRATGTTTTYTRRIYLDKIENGVVSTLNFWNVPSSPGKIFVLATEDTIAVSRGPEGSREFVGAHTTTFNQDATLHGVARRSGGLQGTRLDDFLLRAA